jgi:hypothetical protein
MAMADEEIEATDRYQALGIPYPDPDTMRPGQCEGIGRYPLHRDDATATQYEREQWELEEAANPAADGVHFIVCGECQGTGKREIPRG